jgi:hypothetical protein
LPSLPMMPVPTVSTARLQILSTSSTLPGRYSFRYSKTSV